MNGYNGFPYNAPLGSISLRFDTYRSAGIHIPPPSPTTTTTNSNNEQLQLHLSP